MFYVLTLYDHDSYNKLQRTPAQITFQHKLTMYRLHYKNAYSDEKEPKRRAIEWERNEKRDRKEKNRIKKIEEIKTKNEDKKLKNIKFLF